MKWQHNSDAAVFKKRQQCTAYILLWACQKVGYVSEKVQQALYLNY